MQRLKQIKKALKNRLITLMQGELAGIICPQFLFQMKEARSEQNGVTVKYLASCIGGYQVNEVQILDYCTCIGFVNCPTYQKRGVKK